MSEKLTDEQLRDYASDIRPPVRDMATELLAIRAERAKPTRSDEERAHQFMSYNFGDDELGSAEHAELVRTLTLFSAEARTEGISAKPTPGDAELARKVVHDLCSDTCQFMDGCGCYNNILSAFASIRAEGSAELEATNAAMDDEIASHQDTLRLWNEFRAERAKLEAALRSIAEVAVDIPDSWSDSHQCVTECGHFRRAAAALTQPAESVATVERATVDELLHALTLGAKP